MTDRKFRIYHPFLTFSDPLNSCFVEPGGKNGCELYSDTEALFLLGKEAYNRLPNVESREDFDSAHKGYTKFIEELRVLYQTEERRGRLKLINSHGDETTLDWGDAQDCQILDLAWKTYSALGKNFEAESKQLHVELFLIHALVEVDNALLGIALGGNDAVFASIEAANALSNAIAIESGNEKLQEARRDLAYRGAIARIERDPKQKEKSFIFGCWQQWQQSPAVYASKAAFARDMLTKCEYLTSQKKIEDWCREWEKPNHAG